MKPPLETYLALLEAALQPLANALSGTTSLNSVTAYVKDLKYPAVAAPVVTIYGRHATKKRLEFVQTAIEGRQINLSSSVLGDIFRSKQSRLHKSRLNPSQTIWGGVIATSEGAAVIECRFDTRTGRLPTEAAMTNAWQEYKDDIRSAMTPILKHAESLSDALYLNVPITPNAFVIKWDVADSMHYASRHYGDLRHFLLSFQHIIRRLLPSGARLLPLDGDGQYIIIPLPDKLDPHSAKELRVFARQVIPPLLTRLEYAHQTLSDISTQPIRLHLGVGLGYVEITAWNDDISPAMWEINSKMRAASGGTHLVNISYTPTARAVLSS